MATLPGLPAEMMDHITSQLSLQDRKTLSRVNKRLDRTYWSRIRLLKGPIHIVLKMLTKLPNLVELNLETNSDADNDGTPTKEMEDGRKQTQSNMGAEWNEWMANRTASCLTKLQRLSFWFGDGIAPVPDLQQQVPCHSAEIGTSQSPEEHGGPRLESCSAEVLFAALLELVAPQLTHLSCSTRFIWALPVCTNLIELKLIVAEHFTDLSDFSSATAPNLESLTVWRPTDISRLAATRRTTGLTIAGFQRLQELDLSLMPAFDGNGLLRFVKTHPAIHTLHIESSNLDSLPREVPKLIPVFMKELNAGSLDATAVATLLALRAHFTGSNNNNIKDTIVIPSLAAMPHERDFVGTRLLEAEGFTPDVLIDGGISALALAAERTTPSLVLKWLRVVRQQLLRQLEKLGGVLQEFVYSPHWPLLSREMNRMVPEEADTSFLGRMNRYAALRGSQMTRNVLTKHWVLTTEEIAQLHFAATAEVDPDFWPSLRAFFLHLSVPMDEQSRYTYLCTMLDLHAGHCEIAGARLANKGCHNGPRQTIQTMPYWDSPYWDSRHSDSGATPLMYACANQDVSSAVIEELMNVESISATIVDNDGNTALHHLMASNRRSIRTSAILALLQRGGSFVARNHAGQTALEVLYDIHAGSGTFSATLIQLMKTHSPDMAEENIQKAKEAATEALTVAILLHPEPHANCMTPDALQLFSDFHTAKTLQSIDIILWWIKGMVNLLSVVTVAPETALRQLEALKMCGMSIKNISATVEAILTLPESITSNEILNLLVKEMGLNLSEVGLNLEVIKPGLRTAIQQLMHTTLGGTQDDAKSALS